MKTETHKDTISVYCGTFGKYAAGSLAGEWVDLSQFAHMDEFMEYIRNLHKDEADPEFMFQDIDNETLLPSRGEPDLYDIARFIDFLQLDEVDRDILAGWVEVNDWQCEDVEEELEKAVDHHQGQFESMEDYAEELYRTCYDIPEHLENYIDWSAIARDLSYEYNMSSNGNIYSCY